MAKHELYLTCSEATLTRLQRSLGAALGLDGDRVGPRLEALVSRLVSRLARSPRLVESLLHGTPPAAYPSPRRRPAGGRQKGKRGP